MLQQQQKLAELQASVAQAPVSAAGKLHPGAGIRCLDDPMMTADINSPTLPTVAPGVGRLTAMTNEVVEEARDRFDRYWSKPDTANGGPTTNADSTSIAATGTAATAISTTTNAATSDPSSKK